MNVKHSGFTLIELMVSVTIVGVVVSVAIPSFQNYLARSQVTEAFASVESAKSIITQYGLIYGVYPGAATDPRNTDLSVSGEFGQASVAANTGVITYLFHNIGNVNAAIAGKKVIFTPPDLGSSNASAGTWDCKTGTDVSPKYLPKACQ